MKVLPTNIPDLEEPCHIYLLTKETKIPRGPNINVSKPAPVFMLQMYSAVFNVEIICGSTSNFVPICYSTSYTFEFPSIIKYNTMISPSPNILQKNWMRRRKVLVTLTSVFVGARDGSDPNQQCLSHMQ